MFFLTKPLISLHIMSDFTRPNSSFSLSRMWMQSSCAFDRDGDRFMPAQTFDIKVFEEDRNSEPDLTIYMCNLMKENAAKEIALTNEADENILHLAIRHELKGVEEPIAKALDAAFKQKRTSTDQAKKSLSSDGNTPLHDAVDFDSSLGR